jgi:hypothetical protein
MDDIFLHKTSGAFITGYDRLNRRDSEFKRAMREKLAEKVHKKREKEAKAIVFTFSNPPPVSTGCLPPPLRVKQQTPPAVQIPFRDDLDEAFARMFRKDASYIDHCLRDIFAVYSCNWMPMQELFAMLHKHGALVVSTLPLITCRLPVLPIGLLESPWGWHFPYFQTRQFGSTVVYRLSPVFLRVVQ